MGSRDRRIERRVDAEAARVEIEGHFGQLADASFGGVAVLMDEPSNLTVGRTVSGAIAVPMALGVHRFAFRAEVVRVSGCELALHFDAPDYTLMANLRHAFVH